MRSISRQWVPLAGAALGAVLLPATAFAQAACTRYQAFEGRWDGWVNAEKVERRYPQAVLSVPEAFNPDHRELSIVYRYNDYEVTWNLVEGQNVPSLSEQAHIAEDTDGYCQRVRRQSNLAANMPGLRINIDGSYRNGAVAVGFRTRTCCFLYQAVKMTCVGATHYRTYAYEEERPWYDGLWTATMTRQPRPNDCQSTGPVPSPRNPPNFNPEPQ